MVTEMATSKIRKW